MPVIDELGADHEHLGTLDGEVRRRIAAGDERAARIAFDELLAFLRSHTEIEEASLFAALRAEGEMGDQVQALLADHAAAWDAVDALDDTLEPWSILVTRVLDNLHEHITREEYDLFPATLVALSPSGWDAAEQAAEACRAG